MAKKADADKAAEKHLTEAMGGIEATAAAKYAADVAAAKEAEHAALLRAAAAAGAWEWDVGSGYYYNEAVRWYFDPKTKWYYGGDPVAWAQDPGAAVPAASRFGTAPHTGGPEPPWKPKAAGGGAPAAAASSSGGGGGGGHDDKGVLCAAMLPGGRLLAGLPDGRVLLLRFAPPAAG